MNFTEKIKKSRSKKAFTLIELVIVISILAILASIAIPVITSTINASKLSAMESNSATIEMLIKEAVNTSKGEIENIKYNGKDLSTATVEDILLHSNIDLSVLDVQRIGGVDYAISWDSVMKGTVIISGTGITEYDATVLVSTLY